MEAVDWCYTPIVQSGGVYDLKSSAVSNSDPLHAGTIIASLGVRYKSYCSNIGRTYLIDPNKVIISYSLFLFINHQNKLLIGVFLNRHKKKTTYFFLIFKSTSLVS